MSRYALHHDPAHLTEDILDLVVMLELSALIILAEAADVPKITQKVFIAACLVYCSVLSATPLFLPDLPNWDPDTKVQILFLCGNDSEKSVYQCIWDDGRPLDQGSGERDFAEERFHVSSVSL